MVAPRASGLCVFRGRRQEAAHGRGQPFCGVGAACSGTPVSSSAAASTHRRGLTTAASGPASPASHARPADQASTRSHPGRVPQRSDVPAPHQHPGEALGWISATATGGLPYRQRAAPRRAQLRGAGYSSAGIQGTENCKRSRLGVPAMCTGIFRNSQGSSTLTGWIEGPKADRRRRPGAGAGSSRRASSRRASAASSWKSFRDLGLQSRRLSCLRLARRFRLARASARARGADPSAAGELRRRLRRRRRLRSSRRRQRLPARAVRSLGRAGVRSRQSAASSAREPGPACGIPAAENRDTRRNSASLRPAIQPGILPVHAAQPGTMPLPVPLVPPCSAPPPAAASAPRRLRPPIGSQVLGTSHRRATGTRPGSRKPRWIRPRSDRRRRRPAPEGRRAASRWLTPATCHWSVTASTERDHPCPSARERLAEAPSLRGPGGETSIR